MENTTYIPKIVAGLGLGFLLYVIVSNTNPKAQNSGSNGQYIDEGDSNPINEALSIANTLHEAMRGINYSDTDKNEVILTTLSTLNNIQFAQVIKAFGFRGYNTILGNDSSVIGYTLTKYPLKAWLKYELKQSIYNQLKNKFPKYL